MDKLEVIIYHNNEEIKMRMTRESYELLCMGSRTDDKRLPEAMITDNICQCITGILAWGLRVPLSFFDAARHGDLLGMIFRPVVGAIYPAGFLVSQFVLMAGIELCDKKTIDKMGMKYLNALNKIEGYIYGEMRLNAVFDEPLPFVTDHEITAAPDAPDAPAAPEAGTTTAA